MGTMLQEGHRPGLLQHVFGLWTSPGETFPSILRRSQVLAPLVALVLLQALFTVIWKPRIDVREFMLAQVEQSAQWDRASSEQRAQILDAQVQMFPYLVWLGPFILTPLIVAVVAGIYLFIFRFFYAGEINFRQSLAVVAHAFLVVGAGPIVGLVTGPLILLVLFLREDWTVNPQIALQANLSLLLGDREDVPRFLWSVAESLDLFSLWVLWLLALGFAAASARPWTTVLAGALAPWVIYVLAKSTLTALF